MCAKNVHASKRIPSSVTQPSTMKSFAMPIAKAMGPDPCMMVINCLVYSPNIPFMGGKQYWEISTDTY